MTCAQGHTHTLTCSPERGSDRFPCGHRMRECRFPSCSAVLDCYRLDPTTEKCVLLFHLIKRGVQLRDNGIGFISDDDQFDIDLLV